MTKKFYTFSKPEDSSCSLKRVIELHAQSFESGPQTYTLVHTYTLLSSPHPQVSF
jgi:hypothetical protein